MNEQFNISGKVAVITGGGTSGLGGLCIAKHTGLLVP